MIPWNSSNISGRYFSDSPRYLRTLSPTRSQRQSERTLPIFSLAVCTTGVQQRIELNETTAKTTNQCNRTHHREGSGPNTLLASVGVDVARKIRVSTRPQILFPMAHDETCQTRIRCCAERCCRELYALCRPYPTRCIGIILGHQLVGRCKRLFCRL